MLDRVLEVAERAARAAGQVLLSGRGREDVAFKSSFADLVTETDRLSERTIRELIADAFPEHAVLGEETPAPELQRSLGEEPGGVEHLWVVDPLDGTLNFAHGVPIFAVSIAYLHRGQLRAGVIFDPNRDALFQAVAGRGAFLNGRRLAVSGCDRLDRCLLATGFAYDRARAMRLNLVQFNALQHRAQAVRSLGSAALGLAFVAAGWLDGFWEQQLSPWDVAAGILLVREAGGVVTHLDGTPHRLARPDIVASNGAVHETLLAELAAAGEKAPAGRA